MHPDSHSYLVWIRVRGRSVLRLVRLVLRLTPSGSFRPALICVPGRFRRSEASEKAPRLAFVRNREVAQERSENT
jgi:hypothetical protein